MKINDYEIKKVFLLVDGSPKEISFYKSEVLYLSKNMLDEKYETKTDYYYFFKDIKKVYRNNLETNLKKGFSCIVLDSKEEYYPYNNIYNLYLNNDIVESYEIIERKEEKEKGLIQVSYDYLIKFKLDYLTALDSAFFFCKTDEEVFKITQNLNNINTIEETIENAKTEKVKTFLEEKKRQGFKYRVFIYHAFRVKSNRLLLSGCVDHEIKDNFYKQVEKITEIMNKCLFSEKIYPFQVIKMLNSLNISIKKGKKDNERQ